MASEKRNFKLLRRLTSFSDNEKDNEKNFKRSFNYADHFVEYKKFFDDFSKVTNIKIRGVNFEEGFIHRSFKKKFSLDNYDKGSFKFKFVKFSLKNSDFEEVKEKIKSMFSEENPYSIKEIKFNKEDETISLRL